MHSGGFRLIAGSRIWQHVSFADSFFGARLQDARQIACSVPSDDSTSGVDYLRNSRVLALTEIAESRPANIELARQLRNIYYPLC